MARSLNGLPAPQVFGGRWLQLVIGLVCMGLIANLQYSWTLFVTPMHAAMGWPQGGIQVAFTIFIVVETWLGPVEGWLVDRFGPRPVVAGGAILIFVAWMLNSKATSLTELYVNAVIAGIGVGCVYGTCVGNALKWFPEKRGFASGLTAAGFGIGAALTVIPIANSIKSIGYRDTFSTFAMILGGAIFFLSLFMVAPPPHIRNVPRSSTIAQGRRDFTTMEMLRTKSFWVMYLIFTTVCAGGLITTAQIGPIASAFGVASTPVALLGTAMPLLTLTLSIDNLVNGLTRPLGGFVSDRIGRENMMCIVFVGEAVALLGLVIFGHNPVAFLIFAPMIFLCWGEIYALSSALTGDTYGSKHVTANAGALYTTKGVAALCVPFGSVLASVTGSWTVMFVVCAIITASMALVTKLVLVPMRRELIEASNRDLSELGGGNEVQTSKTSLAQSPAAVIAASAN
jgi:OFA family oxalate/formate antiporter-like MFS transporter